MDIKKLAPWNWFKKEEGDDGHRIPVTRTDRRPSSFSRSVVPFMDSEFDRMLDLAGLTTGFGFGRSLLEDLSCDILKPSLDLGATDTEYTISVEVPGVKKEDLTLELDRDTLVIRGEKKQEKEERDKQYYRVERRYGSFQRILSLPEDADGQHMEARFKKGILKVTIPRISLPGRQARQIEIRHID